MEDKVKYCSRCQTTKSILLFNKHKNRYDGVAVYCITCCKEIYYLNKEKILKQKAEYYLINKEILQEKNKEYWLKNKEPLKIKSKKYYNDNKEEIILRSKNNSYKRLYGITVDDFNLKLLTQNNKCEICNKEFTDIGDACLDHNHRSGVIRGILCRNCNWALGAVKENPVIINNMINYLMKNKNAI